MQKEGPAGRKRVPKARGGRGGTLLSPEWLEPSGWKRWAMLCGWGQGRAQRVWWTLLGSQ